MKLADHLRDTKTTLTAFAASVGVNASTICRYAKGKRVPPPEMMQKIIHATGGRVTANDFFEVPARQDAAA